MLGAPDMQHKSPGKFLFFASGGQVHKGLDLLLEVFAAESDLELFVCSSFAAEHDFCDTYQKELYGCSRIHPVGFVDIRSEAFRDIIDQCSYVIMPSCSEGIAGSILTAMSAGLIPIVSRECGFADDEVIHLPSCELAVIRQTCREYADKPLAWIRQEANKSVAIVSSRYNEARYAESVLTAMQALNLIV